MDASLLAWFLSRQEIRRARGHHDPFAMPEEAFRRHFRLPKSTVLWLCEQLADPLERQGLGLSVQDRVMCALRFFAMGCFQSAVGSEETISLSQASVSRCIHDVAAAIVRVGSRQQWVAFPRTASERAAVKQGFLRRGQIPGVVGCVDGTYIAIVGPNLPPAEKQRYWCRKGYYALNTMVVSTVSTTGKKFLSPVIEV